MPDVRRIYSRANASASSDTNHFARFSVNHSLNSSKKVTGCSFTSSTSGKTPTKRSDCKTKKTLSKCTKKSPSKIPNIYTLSTYKCLKQAKISLSLIIGRAITPAKTPNGGDRFIPSRTTTDFELSHFKVSLHFVIKISLGRFCFCNMLHFATSDSSATECRTG